MRAGAPIARLIVAVAVVVMIGGPARADTPLDQARAALDRSDYLGARTALGEALASGKLGRDELAELYRMSGVVAGALGETDAATEAFERMLALSPKAELPAGTSPKIARPFAAAQAYYKDHSPLVIEVGTSAAPPTVTVHLTSDPLGMIDRVQAISRVDGGREEINEQPGDPTVTVELRHGRRIDVRVVALDEHRNRLVEVGTEKVPLVIVGKDVPVERPVPDEHTVVEAPHRPPPPGPHHARPIYARWWLWGGIAVAFAGGGTYFGLAARTAADDLDRLNAQSSMHSFTEATALESRARRDVLFANVGFGLAGAAAIAATILFLTDSGAPPKERAISAAPVPLVGGGAVVLEVPF